MRKNLLNSLEENYDSNIKQHTITRATGKNYLSTKDCPQLVTFLVFNLMTGGGGVGSGALHSTDEHEQHGHGLVWSP